jgi:uncharacterized membrane protein YjdF
MTEPPRPDAHRSVVPVALFTAAYLVPAVVLAVTRGNKEFVFYCVVMAVLIALVLQVHRRSPLTLGALWALSIWGLLHMAGGLVPVKDVGVLYNLWLIPGRLKFDQVVHAYGFGVATWVCWQVLRRRIDLGGSLTGPLVLSAASGMGLGALNEVIEFVATLLVPDTNVGGYVNTGWDLVSNLVGSTSVAVWIGLRETRARRARSA